MKSVQKIKQINKLLVANRGEIAIRIFRAATELNIRTVAVYTYEDRYSLHRYKADQSFQIGDETEPLKPYLDIEEIISGKPKFVIACFDSNKILYNIINILYTNIILSIV
jgi:pyruvate carboxylase